MFTTDGYVIPYMEKHKNNPTYCADDNGNCVPNDEPEFHCDKDASSGMQNISCAIFALANQHPQEKNKDYWHDFINEW